MKRILLIITICISLNAFSQVKISATEFEKKRLEIEKSTLSDNDYALEKAKELLDLAIELKSSSKIAKAQSSLAYVKIFEGKSSEAEQLNNKSLKINSALQDEREIAKNLYNNGIISSRKSDYVKAVEHLFKSIELAKKFNNNILIQRCYRGLANSYCDQRNYDLALKYALESLKYSNKTDNISETSYGIATLAEIYRLKGDLKNAEYNFQKAFSEFKKIKEEHGMAYVLTNWSLCYDKDFIKVFEMEMEAQKIWDEIAPENLMSVTNLGNIAYAFYEIAQNDSLKKVFQKKYPYNSREALLSESEKYYDKCLTIAKKQKNLDCMLFYSESLSELQRLKGDYKNAYINLQLRNKINDSLYSQKNKNRIAALESEKEIEVRDKQIQINKINIQNKEKQKWYFVGGLLMLSFIGILLFNQSRNRKKTNEKLQKLNSELDEANKTKTRFFSILNHDLRSPVSNLIHFLHLQKESPELLDDESKKRLENKTIAGAENLLIAMEDMLLWSKGQMENFKPQPKKLAIKTVFEDTQKHFESEEVVQIKFENTQNIEVLTDENYLKTIIRNLTGNAIKALEKTANPIIVWKAWKENDTVYLSVSDNGSGASREQFKALYDDKEVVGIKSGLGLHLIRDLAKAINCEIAVKSSENGTTFTLKI
jgi:signal transduction histidine kinase